MKLNSKKNIRYLKKCMSFFTLILIILMLFFLVKIKELEICDVFMGLFILIYFFVVIITLSTSFTVKEEELIEKAESLGFANIRRLVSLKYEWNKAQYMFSAAHYFFVMCSIISAIIVIFVDQDLQNTLSILEDKAVVFYTCMSIFFTILDILINPLKMAQGYRTGFEKLSIAILRYVCGVISKDRLIEILEECERGISIGLLFD